MLQCLKVNTVFGTAFAAMQVMYFPWTSVLISARKCPAAFCMLQQRRNLIKECKSKTDLPAIQSCRHLKRSGALLNAKYDNVHC